jgi:hypothetical protein
MNTFIKLFLFLIVSSFAQSNNEGYITILKEVDEYYSELSSQKFPNYIKFSLSVEESLKIFLYSVEGKLVYEANYSFVDIGTYIVKFYNPQYPGVYIVSLKIGKQMPAKKSILITSEKPPSTKIEINPDTSTTIIDGIWKRGYSENLIPSLQPDAEFHELEYHLKYDLQLIFSKGSYRIISEITKDDGKSGIKSYVGNFAISGDTLKLYENSNLQELFQFKIEKDSLSLSYFVYEKEDKEIQSFELPMNLNINKPRLKIAGRYYKK